MKKKSKITDAEIISDKVSHGILVDTNHIKKIKLNDDVIECSFQLIGVGKISFEGENVVHSDLKNALKELAPHWAAIADQKEDEYINKKNFSKTDLSKFDNIVITGVSLNGDSFTIIGSKIIDDRTINISPSMKNDEYEHIDAFGETVERLLYECKMYISGDKFYLKQEVMDFPEDNDGGESND
ncbi:hypothetical protein UFOVP1596_23 [uncultured Caudovirales phage]|uniref:Uncharacterized protein n=1 Tax=uncultured Caudovirales phage TaxID=2100421 RepID=A0A6J5SVL0_9CAUD|nr:hypothetical protein UFOVP1596_23 [uncultured Caudovirales phage]